MLGFAFIRFDGGGVLRGRGKVPYGEVRQVM